MPYDGPLDEQVDSVVAATVDYGLVSPVLGRQLGLTQAGIDEALFLGYVVDRDGTLYPTPAGAAYRPLIDQEPDE